MPVGVQPVLPPSTRGIVEFLGAGVNPQQFAPGSATAPDFRVILAQLLANRTSSQFSLLFGEEDTQTDAFFGNFMAGVSPTASGVGLNGSLFGQTLGNQAIVQDPLTGLGGIGAASAQLLQAASRLIGNNAQATILGQTISGRVNTATQRDGRIFITINNREVPLESVRSFSLPR